MNYNKGAKSLTFRRGTKASQEKACFFFIRVPHYLWNHSTDPNSENYPTWQRQWMLKMLPNKMNATAGHSDSWRLSFPEA